MTNIVPVRPAAPTPLAEIEKLAEAVAKSGMFGIRTKDQALVLMAISQAEGRHPALAARDYDIIQGRPAKKAEAMLRDMLDSGGRVEWHELTDTVADATFQHPAGGKIRIRWDTEKARQAGLLGKEMYKKFPRAMMRSRCVSEGVKTVCPMATSGMYTPEEVVDIPPPESEPAASVAAELDAFAAGERLGLGVPDEPASQDDTLPDAVRLGLEQAAMRGVQALRAHAKTIDPRTRAMLDAGTINELRRVAVEAEEAQREADPFGLLPVEAPPFVDSPELPRSAIWDDETYVVTLRSAETGPQWKEWSTQMGHLASEAATIEELDKLFRDNDSTMSRARRESGDDWRHIRDAVDARRKALT